MFFVNVEVKKRVSFKTTKNTSKNKKNILCDFVLFYEFKRN
jgi:hypothetical protein